MRKFFIRFLSIFIINKNKRKNFRNKYLKNQLEINTEDIMREIKNLNFKQELIMNYFMDIKSAKPATGMLRQHQINNVYILQRMKKICDDNKLQYWIDFGTLLGATRHKGFIPWDDDLDTSMPEKDYEAFKQIAPDLLCPDIKLVECQDGHLHLEHVGYKQGCIDVFKYSDFGDRLQKTFLTKLFPNDYALIPKEIIFPLSEMTFESVSVSVPNNVDKYLRCRYGNYMLFPKSIHAWEHTSTPTERILFYDEDVQ